MGAIRISFTREEFQQLVDYYGFACKVTPEQMKIYLLSLKRTIVPITSSNQADSRRDALTRELMETQTKLAALTHRFREVDERATQLERARGAILEENDLLKKELRRLSWENGQLRKGVSQPEPAPEIETLDVDGIIKGWASPQKSTSLWERIFGKK